MGCARTAADAPGQDRAGKGPCRTGASGYRRAGRRGADPDRGRAAAAPAPAGGRSAAEPDAQMILQTRKRQTSPACARLVIASRRKTSVVLDDDSLIVMVMPVMM